MKFRPLSLVVAATAWLGVGAVPASAAPSTGGNAGASIPQLRIATDYQLSTLDPTKYSSATVVIYSKLEAQLQEDLPYIALYQQDYTIALSRGFTVPHFNELGFMFDDYALQIKRAP